MLFIVQFEDIYTDHPERLPERAQHMPTHWAKAFGSPEFTDCIQALDAAWSSQRDNRP
ncbi:hypothetical protein [Rhodoferax sp.]|uniref:hypothetical protein n=1 Tax=Rhodoferax sp. TaxID=50421 RepID=UPI0026200E02|nr:hypothetical protein [Rhodoferax sp.]MDD2925075.1 hypothetical protein [Rhodoferax sp.]